MNPQTTFFILVFAVAAPLAHAKTQSQIAVDALVAQYDFAEGSGNQLRDSVAGLVGRIEGATWVRIGQQTHALQFDGNDDFVDLGSDPRLGVEGPLSLEAWILPHQLPIGEGFLLGRGPGSFLLTYSGAAYPARLYWHIAKDAKMVRAKAAAWIWHHVLATYDGNLLRIYLDGALQGGVRAWKHQPGTPEENFKIGGGVAGFPHFQGLVSGLRVYNVAVTREQAFARYQATLPNYPNEAPAGENPWKGKGVRRLNNLVAELARRERIDADAEIGFTNPREGWVFVAAKASLEPGAKVGLYWNDEQEPVTSYFDAPRAPVEAMRYLPAGKHVVRVSPQGGALIDELIIRAIPELLYGAYPSGTAVPAFGKYNWEYLQRDILPNVTTMVGLPPDDQEQIVRQWRSAGRKWIAEHSAGWYDYSAKKASETEDDFFRVITGKPGMTHSLTDGVLLDTHDVGHSNRYSAYARAVERICGDERFRGRDLYFYCDSLFGAPMSELFAQTLLDQGCRLMWTNYLHEQRTEAEAEAFLEARLAREAVGWEKRFPGSVRRMHIGLGYLTSPGERMNVNPATNYRVLMDMQCRILATHPVFDGLAGVFWYKASYVNDEPLRWSGRLFRHYFIEGNTTLLSTDPYELSHIDNPDFDDGTEGWTLEPAEKGSIEPGYLDRYGFAQGRWLETGPGDNFVRLCRSGNGPNRISQTIRDLEPGRLYTLKVYTCDYDALINHETTDESHAVSIGVEGAEAIADKSFQYPYSSYSYYHLGPYDDEEPTDRHWINFHYHVFRARETTARLTISDWREPDEAGGPTGQQLMVNFVEVQPFLE